MNKRALWFYWILLLVPTVAVGVKAVDLLRHEQERINQTAVQAVTDRARALADTLQLTVAETKAQFMSSLREVPPAERLQTLIQWQDRHFLVRNSFIWYPSVSAGDGIAASLQHPPGDGTATNEELRFRARYEAFFSGRQTWYSTTTGEAQAATPLPDAAQPALPRASLPQPPATAQSEFLKDMERLQSGRMKVARLAQQAVTLEGALNNAIAGDIAEPAVERGGWIPWFEESRLHILGWLQLHDQGPVFGIELELMALLSLLLPEFPPGRPDTVYALIDGNGEILHQSIGPAVGTAQATGNIAMPHSTISLAPHLPHWQVAVYFPDGPPVNAGSRSFFFLSLLLLAIFMIAIVAGAGLLTWQAVRNYRDARQKTSFVANVSHELKTPLTSIRMYAELLHQERVPDPRKKQRYLQVIVDESQRLARLVNNVLDFSRLEQGRKRYHPQHISLHKYLEETLEVHRMRIQNAGLRLELDLPQTDCRILFDRDALDQVVLNLIDNAIKYAATGGSLKFSLAIAEKKARIAVQDQGRGIPSGFEKRIFDRFERVDRSLTTRQPGSGLGLSIARRLMRDQNGDLVYSAATDGGSCFTIILSCDNQS